MQGLFWLSPSAHLHFKRFHKSKTSNHQDAKVGCTLQRFLLPKMKGRQETGDSNLCEIRSFEMGPLEAEEKLNNYFLLFVGSFTNLMQHYSKDVPLADGT